MACIGWDGEGGRAGLYECLASLTLDKMETRVARHTISGGHEYSEIRVNIETFRSEMLALLHELASLHEKVTAARVASLASFPWQACCATLHR